MKATKTTGPTTRYVKQIRKRAVNRIAYPYATEADSLAVWRARVLSSILFTALVLGALTLVVSSAALVREKAWKLALFDGSCFVMAMALFFSTRIRYEVRATVSLLMCFAIGIAVVYTMGPLSGGTAWLFAFAVLVGVLLGPKAAFLAITLNAVSLTVFGWLFWYGSSGREFVFFQSLSAMIAAGTNFIFLNTLAAVSVAALVRGLVSTHEKERISNRKLEQEHTQLAKAKEDLELEILDRRQAEKALGDSEERYRIFIDNAPMAMFTINLRGEFTYANKNLLDLTGYKAVDWMHKPFHPIVCPQDLDALMGRIQARIAGRDNSDPHEIRIFNSAGNLMWVEVISKSIFETDECGSKKLVGIQSFVTDVTQRKQAEQALQKNEERFRTLVEESTFGLSLIAKDGRYKYVNPRFQKMFGYSIQEVSTGRVWFKRLFPQTADRHEAIKTWMEDQGGAEVGTSRVRVFTVTCRDGIRKKIKFRTIKMQNLDRIVIYDDITERARMEEQLQQAQKFEAIGTLAGGIAHDFNNLLMGIQGRASLMAVELDTYHPQQEHIEAIETYVRSATDLTRQLLGFARGGKYEVKPIDICELLRNTAVMFGRTRKEIHIHTKTDPECVVVEADQRQIEQVLLNLFVNAWQAMLGGGEIHLETSAVSLDAAYCDPYGVNPGSYARISVTDNGIGMDEATRQRIFDPFFTTKEKDRGTGLGLASAYGIIKNHGGIMTVYSETGRGSTFNIYLPCSDQEVQPEVLAEDRLQKGSETILLVDDEKMIIEVGQALLQKLAYRVIVAHGGQEAVAKVSEMGDQIDLVILDMIMPGMDGSETFGRIRDIRSAMPIMLSSGYSLNDQANEIMRRGCNGFIQKPFNISELSQAIRKILDEANAPVAGL